MLREYLEIGGEMEKFWMVWREGGQGPTMKHGTLKSAMEEAERLARQFPEKNFVVLESLKFCYVTTPVVWKPTDEIPF